MKEGHSLDVWDVALGFMDSQVLLTAEELGVFDRLENGGCTAAAVADAVGIPEDSAERLLTALCALELTRKLPDGRFVNGPEASEQLVRGKPGYIGAMFPHLRDDLYPIWRHFKQALIEGKAQWERAFPGVPAPHEKVHSDPESLRSFLEGMHAITYQAAAEFAGMAREIQEIGSLVDIGGASGAFVIALAEAAPSLRGTVFDLPEVEPVARDFFRKSGFEDRLEFAGGDFWSDPLPAGADAYSLGYILHDWDTAGGDILLGKVAEACPPGGMLIIGEFFFNDEKTGPRWVARSDLNMLAAARGRERSAREYAEWIARFGFQLRQIYLTSKGKNFLIARKVEQRA